MSVNVDLAAASSFMATHARIVDRRRYELLIGAIDDPHVVLAALDAYRNNDGGYGWGMEPDLRAEESQPAAAMHAFEVLAECGATATTRAVELCDWLHSVMLPDGGLPFALPLDNSAGCAPFWAQADHSTSSLQITAAVTANAHRVAPHASPVAEHPWLAKATEYCLNAVAGLSATPHAYELNFALNFLDTIAGTLDDASGLLERLGRHLPADGTLKVEGGTEDERLRPVDIAPNPNRPVRRLFGPGVIDADLDRLARDQQPDGGWPVDFINYSPAAELEWRGYVTVNTIGVLRRNE